MSLPFEVRVLPLQVETPLLNLSDLMSGKVTIAPLYIVEPDRAKEPPFFVGFFWEDSKSSLDALVAEYNAGTPTLRAILRAIFDTRYMTTGKSNMRINLLFKALSKERENPTR